MIRIILGLLLILFSTHLWAEDTSDKYKPNGNYSFVEFGLVKTTQVIPICSGINSGECYKTLRGSELTASLQILSIPNLLISVSSTSQGASGSSDNLTYASSKLLIGLIGGLGPVDALISAASLNADTLSCPIGSNICQDVLENGADYGAMAKLWFGDAKNFNVGLTVDRYSYSPNTATISKSIFVTWLPATHHSLSIRFNSERDINGTEISTGGKLSYAYLF